MQHLSFCAWLISHKNSSAVLLSEHNRIFFLIIAEEFSIVHMYHIFFICSSTDEHIGCFHFLATVNNTTGHKNICLAFTLVWMKILVPFVVLLYLFSLLPCLIFSLLLGENRFIEDTARFSSSTSKKNNIWNLISCLICALFIRLSFSF